MTVVIGFISIFAVILASYALGQSFKNAIDIEHIKDMQQIAVDKFMKTLEEIKEMHEEDNK